VKLCDTPASAAGHYSAVLAYLSQCTSVGDLEILDTSLRQVMRLQESGETLQSLRLTNNHIAELQLESFSGLSKLRVLDLGSNKVVRIPSGVFRSNRRLRRLYLARNVISFITRQSFLGKINLYIHCLFLSSYFTVSIVLTTSVYICFNLYIR
jgi:Leucine-rich repeat (LRR) protein